MDLLSYVLTSGLSIAGGAVGVYFWMRGKALDLRAREAIVKHKESDEEVAAGATIAKTAQDLAAWQSELFKRRTDDMEAKIAKHELAMRALHEEHLACLRRDARREGELEAQKLKIADLIEGNRKRDEEIAAQETRIQLLEREIARLHGKTEPLAQVASTLDHIENETTLSRVEQEKQTQLLTEVAKQQRQDAVTLAEHDRPSEQKENDK